MILLIAGMHRSGTSLFARFCHDSGIDMGRELYQERITNPHGHYEDLEFLALHRRELRRLGPGVTSLYPGEEFFVTRDFTPSPAFREEAAALLARRREAAAGAPWGWKDPRSTLFLETWAGLEGEIRVVALVRPPEPVVNSLCRRLRGYFSRRRKGLFLETYTHYNRKVLDFNRARPDRIRILLLEELVARPDAVLAGLASFLGATFDAGLFREQFDPALLTRPRPALLWFNRGELARARSIYAELEQAHAGGD